MFKRQSVTTWIWLSLWFQIWHWFQKSRSGKACKWKSYHFVPVPHCCLTFSLPSSSILHEWKLLFWNGNFYFEMHAIPYFGFMLIKNPCRPEAHIYCWMEIVNNSAFTNQRFTMWPCCLSAHRYLFININSILHYVLILCSFHNNTFST